MLACDSVIEALKEDRPRLAIVFPVIMKLLSSAEEAGEGWRNAKVQAVFAKFPETGGSDAKVQFISGHKLLFYRIALKRDALLHFNRSKMVICGK
ncbi:hypothetical protein NYE69_01130 [Paenibacillus sp. FSL R5-0527]|uniref:hypothetical protein n=1 Tax=Paenibacillus sp. FSL R5-0527 TaxID=2975321 RepID=UPI00097B8169|nr:hypothetical protein BK140_29830 [Paenibacillus macerans]